MKKPFVSVIVPTYNRGYCIGRAVESVLRQSYDNFELLVVDNFSTDETQSVLAHYNDKRLSCLKFKNDGVIARSRNYGLKLSNGEYVAFLDSDDYWHPEKLESSVSALLSGADLVYTAIHLKRASDSSLPQVVHYWQVRKPVSRDLYTYANPIACSTVVVRAGLFRQINGFNEDPDLLGAEDYDAWVRLSFLSDKFVYLVRPLTVLQVSGDAVTNPSRTIRFSERILQLYRRSFDKDLFPIGLYYELAKAYLSEGFTRKAFSCYVQVAIHAFLGSPLRPPFLFVRSLISIAICLSRFVVKG